MSKNLDSIINNQENVSIFGTGSLGVIAHEFLSNIGIKVTNFYDNDKNKHNTMLCGCEISNPDLIPEKKQLIIIASTWKSQIIQQLKEMSYEYYTFIDILGIEKEYESWKENKKNHQLNLEFFQKNTQNISKWSVPKLIKNSNEAWAKKLTKLYDKDTSFPASLSPAAGELYRSLILNMAPRLIVEIGVFMGASTIWAASALKDLGGNGHICSIDLFNKEMEENHIEYVQHTLESAEISDMVTLLQLNSCLDFEKFVEHLAGKKIDFLFIDGDHTPRGARSDFLKFNEHLSTGGYILLHDVFPEYCGWEGPAFVIDKYIRKNHCYELCQIYTTPNNYGMALIRKIREK